MFVACKCTLFGPEMQMFYLMFISAVAAYTVGSSVFLCENGTG